jgi:hypothetical protein
VKKAGELSTAFWDSSALVPLCIQENTSRQVRSHLRKFAPVVWWASLVHRWLTRGGVEAMDA